MWLDLLCQPFLRTQSKVAVTGVSKLAFVPKNQNTVPPQDVPNEEKGIFILFFCAMIAQRNFDKLGLLDEGFSPGIGEDIDYCFRAQKLGFTIESVPVDKPTWEFQTTYPIYHVGGVSFGRKHDIFVRNMGILTKRWKDGYYK
jgi:hypothetical protein